ncbi:MAG TPA: hypothetical protein PLP81_11675, partial [Saprospiraceae bacterium]|nr:hypothetical protein [Saprospiraceae bacterium]
MKNNKPLALVCKRLSEVNSDFEELVMLLNQELAIINGDKNDFFIQFNNIDQLRHIVIAYQSGRAVGCGAMKVYGDNMMEIKRMYVRQPYRG